MNNLAIAVLAHKRPNYLYVSLDAIFKLKGIENCFVNLYIDGGLSSNIIQKQIDVAFNFPISQVTLRKENLGCLRNVLDGIQSTFKYGIEKVLYVEEDMIIRQDALQYLQDITLDSAFYNLVHPEGNKHPVYTPGANMIEQGTFNSLYLWIMSGQHIGKIRPIYNETITKETTSHDGVFYSYVVENKVQTRYPKIPYAAHFGLHGMNHGLNEVEIEFEKYMFSGEKDTWLKRIISIIEGNENISSKVKKSLFFPKSFKYNGIES